MRECLSPGPGRRAEPLALPGVTEPATQRLPESLRVAGRDQQAGPAAVGCVAESLRYATDLPGDDRKTAGKRLGDDHAVGLRARGQHQDVRLCVRAVEPVRP